MPALGKEIESQLTPDEQALIEIQGYIDRVERQAETHQSPVNKLQIVQPSASAIPTQQSTVPASLASVYTKPNITLPLHRSEVEGGLKKSLSDGLRWLSEWCIMMIKKYPGRVFYMPQNTNR